MVFIRAPKFDRVGPGVEVIATEGDDPVAVRQGSVMAATFHPELSTTRAFTRPSWTSSANKRSWEQPRFNDQNPGSLGRKIICKKSSVCFGSLVWHPRLVCNPVHFPRLAAIV